MCICMLVFVQFCWHTQQNLCSRLSQKATKQCEHNANSFWNGYMLNMFSVNLELVPAQNTKSDKIIIPACVIFRCFIYTDNTQPQSWFRRTTGKSSFPLHLPMLLPCIPNHFTSNRRLPALLNKKRLDTTFTKVNKTPSRLLHTDSFAWEHIFQNENNHLPPKNSGQFAWLLEGSSPLAIS